MYPNKYIAVNHLSKDKHGVIVGADVIKVYDSLEECKKSINEINFLLKIYKNDFDIIYGDFTDYVVHYSQVSRHNLWKNLSGNRD
jgi:hypothetical protein